MQVGCGGTRRCRAGNPGTISFHQFSNFVLTNLESSLINYIKDAPELVGSRSAAGFFSIAFSVVHILCFPYVGIPADAYYYFLELGLIFLGEILFTDIFLAPERVSDSQISSDRICRCFMERITYWDIHIILSTRHLETALLRERSGVL